MARTRFIVGDPGEGDDYEVNFTCFYNFNEECYTKSEI